MTTNDIKRNAIVFVKNPVPHNGDSHIMKGDHFAIVVQNDIGNTYSDSVIVCYVTSKIKRLDIKTNVCLQFYEGLNNKPAMVKCSQIMTVDKSNIVSVVDNLRPEDVIRFNRALKTSLDIEEVVHG